MPHKWYSPRASCGPPSHVAFLREDHSVSSTTSLAAFAPFSSSQCFGDLQGCSCGRVLPFWQDGCADQTSFLSLIDNDNKSKAITYKILFSDVARQVLAQPPSLTNISDTVSYFLAKAFSKTWKKTKIYHGPGLISFSTFLSLFFSDKTPLQSLKQKKNHPLTLFSLSVLTEGLG